MMRHGRRRHAVAIFLAVACAPHATAGAEPIDALMRTAVEQMRSAGGLQIGDASLTAVNLLGELYVRREYQPAWNRPENVDALLRLLAAADAHGLDPDDYDLSTLEDLRRQIAASADPDPVLLVAFDLLLTDGLARLGYHLRFGKVVPDNVDANWNFGRKAMTEDVVQRIQDAIDSESLGDFVRQVAPQHEFYEALQDSLAEHRRIAASGGWPSVPGGGKLERGARGQRVRALRERFGLASGQEFDTELDQSVRRFQELHGLGVDGVVGPATIEAMNVPVEVRIDQLRVNLERTRWVFRDVDEEDDFILVNIAGFHVYFIQDERVAWSGRAQVGKTYRKTPVFRAKMTYVELNPTWTVPPTILAKDVLPAIQKDPEYLARKNMRVIDSAGRTVDPTSIRWSSYSGRDFPYAIRQDPGPHNALGRIKFIFPNEHFVFLHDTPSRGLFDHVERTFSSGCIRVENPFELAEIVLDDPARSREQMLSEVGGKTERVFLDEPMTVMLLYWTAGGQAGSVQFLKDVYGRDPAVLEALDGDFVFVAPHGMNARWSGD